MLVSPTVTKQWVTAQCELFLLLSLIFFFATVIGVGCALLSITTGNAWRLFLEDREG
jgi:hypothetical protein